MSWLRRSAEWRLLGEAVFRAAPRLAAAWWGLVLLRSAVPALLVVAIGLLVGVVEAGGPLAGPLALMALLLVLMQSLAPLHGAVSANLGERTAAWLHERLLVAASAPAGIRHLERAELMDEFALARDFDLGVTGPPLSVCMPFVASGFVELGGGLAAAALLFGHRWWAPAVLVACWAGTHVLLRESMVWRGWREAEVTERQRHAEYAYRMAVDVPAAKEVRLFGLQDWTVGRFAARRLELLGLSLEALRLRQRPLVWTLLLVVTGNALVFGTLAADALAGARGLQALVVFAGAAVGASRIAASDFDWWLDTASRPVPVIDELTERMPAEGRLPGGPRPAGGLPREGIRLRGVRFGYGEGEEVLRGVDLDVPAGRSLAIVGRNGSGKTTLAKLLCRLYDPDAGAIEVDGTDLRALDHEDWRRRLAAVFQDFVRYELPLRDNVAPGGGADDGAVTWALRAAGADGLADLPTVLSRAYDGGVELSGGQWQRVALARALCAMRLGAGVLLLDEPTSQLDVRGELEVFERLLQAMRGRTVILVSHRFTTVRRADRIVVLEGGRVVEAGSHTELMAAGGRYRTMYTSQAERFGSV